jgi:hypothetical protein
MEFVWITKLSSEKTAVYADILTRPEYGQNEDLNRTRTRTSGPGHDLDNTRTWERQGTWTTPGSRQVQDLEMPELNSTRIQIKPGRFWKTPGHDQYQTWKTMGPGQYLDQDLIPGSGQRQVLVYSNTRTSTALDSGQHTRAWKIN